MKSLILTILYLAKDTVHRWFTRLSSPLARVLVVFFLSLCALAFLGSVAISTKVARERIIERGANMVVSFMSTGESGSVFIPSQTEISDLLNADSFALTTIGDATLADGHKATLYTCSFSRLNQILPLLSPSGGPTLLQDGVKCNLPQGPSEITVPGGQRVPIYVRTLPQTHPLMNIMHGKGILVQEELLRQMDITRLSSQYVLGLSIRDLTSSAPVQRAEEFLNTLQRMEGVQGITISALELLRELDVVLDKQMQFRIAFCVGISCIVGILLTALAGMEYRQNEYIYTLMKSFGIHPILLVGSFIMENLIIVGASFAGAVAAFMYFQRIIVKQILKLGNQPLALEEIMPEIMLISYTLLGCVLISSIPIFVAAHREIGRVLK